MEEKEMKYSEIEKKLQTRKIGEIEQSIDNDHQTSFISQRQMIFALRYLKNTKRYKENPTYKNSAFETYLTDRFNMRWGTYKELEYAFVKLPAEAIIYGPGLITKISRICGRIKIKQVTDKIKNAAANLKQPIKRNKIESIIREYALPGKEKIPMLQKRDYEALYDREKRAHLETKDKLRAAYEQIGRLQRTIKLLRDSEIRINGDFRELKGADNCQFKNSKPETRNL